MTREWWQQFGGVTFEGTNGGDTLGNLLGLGGFGAVFTASSRRFEKPLAIKLIVPGADEFDAQFRELVRGLQMRHPSLVQCLDCGAVTLPQSRFLYMAMELASGTLEDVLARNQTLPPDELICLAQSIACGLEYLHVEHKLVHRDLKPANVLWVAGEWKLADYGVARTVDSKSAAHTSRVVGTVDYMPPESFNGFVSPAWDIWAFGVLLTRTLTGQKPFSGNTPTEVIGQIVLSQPDLSAVPGQWTALIRSCLQRQPELRPTAAQIVPLLRAIADQPTSPAIEEPLPTPVEVMPSPNEAVAAGRKRRMPWVAAAVVLLGAAIAGGAYYAANRLPSPGSLTTAQAAYDLGYKIDLEISLHKREASEGKLAISYYNRAVELATSDSAEDREIALKARNQRTSLNFYGPRDCPAVIQDYSFVLDHKPDFYAFFNRGQCYEQIGEPQKALRDFDSAANANAKSDYLFKLRAELLERLGRKAEALADWDRAFTIDPNGIGVKEKRERLASELGRK